MKDRKEILQDLIASEQTQCVLKIKLTNARNPVITAVDKIAKNRIILKPTCLYGYRLRKRNITLVEIESITRYKTRFDSPLFARLRFIRDNFSSLRHNVRAVRRAALSNLS